MRARREGRGGVSRGAPHLTRSLVPTPSQPAVCSSPTQVPLSLEAKLKNIEDTEAAKKALLAKGGLALEEEGEGVGPGARRGMYPVHFGRRASMGWVGGGRRACVRTWGGEVACLLRSCSRTLPTPLAPHRPAPPPSNPIQAQAGSQGPGANQRLPVRACFLAA